MIDFLKYLDEKHTEYLSAKRIRNRGFILYSKLQSLDVDTNEGFLIAKSIKSRILLVHGKVWVDLTDYDIVNVIIGLEDDIVKQLLRELREGYDGEWKLFKFKIDDIEYEGKGIDYSKFDLKKRVTLEADFTISLGELLFVINMILYKDIEGQKYVKKEDEGVLIERTIIKYISLILYYKYSNFDAEEYLRMIEYPLFEKDRLLKEKMKVHKYDKRFTQKGFDKLKEMC